jgi:hypothetical protein
MEEILKEFGYEYKSGLFIKRIEGKIMPEVYVLDNKEELVSLVIAYKSIKNTTIINPIQKTFNKKYQEELQKAILSYLGANLKSIKDVVIQNDSPEMEAHYDSYIEDITIGGKG